MKNMVTWKWWKDKFGAGEASIEKATSPLLKIMVGNKHVADLYHDGESLCLTYKPAFLDVGIPPFNPEDLGPSETPKVDVIYRRPELWFVFAERISTLGRRDFVDKMKQLGLTKDSDPLELLGNLGTVSISKPWRLELVKKVT